MTAIEIKRTADDVRRQLYFIQDYENKRDRYEHKLPLKWFLGISLFVLLLFTITPKDSLIVIKGVSFILVGLMWIAGIIYALWFWNKKAARYKWIKKTVEETMLLQGKHFLEFDEEGLKYTTDNYTIHYKWSYYTAYDEDPSTIYLFPEGTIFSCHSFSAVEIGEDQLEQLKTIAKERMLKLSIGYKDK